MDDDENYDTGDASLDDIRNQDNIGDNELLVLSFGTSYNDSRRLTIGAIEGDLEKAFPDFSVRRGFTANIIIDHVQRRDNILIDDVDAALERAMSREAHDTFGKRGANMMKTDVKQTADGNYDVAVDLPGCKKEDVQMELNDGYLTIQAVRSHSNDEKDKEGRYLRRETFSGTCARSFYVGDAVKKEDIHAKFEDGILHITLPAPQQQKALPVNPNLIEIE